MKINFTVNIYIYIYIYFKNYDLKFYKYFQIQTEIIIIKFKNILKILLHSYKNIF